MLSNPKVRKFAILMVYAALGALAQAEIVPESVTNAIRDLVTDNTLTVLATILGIGHVLPEAAQKKS